MGNHPKINVPAGKWEKAVNVTSVLLIAAMFIYVIKTYNNLPETIATHFNANGEPDRWGSKNFVFLMPAMAVILFIPMFLLSKAPHIFNYHVKITKENAKRIYPLAKLFVAVINVEMVLLFFYITLAMIQTAHGHMGLGTWFIVVIVLVTAITITIFMIRMKQLE